MSQREIDEEIRKDRLKNLGYDKSALVELTRSPNTSKEYFCYVRTHTSPMEMITILDTKKFDTELKILTIELEANDPGNIELAYDDDVVSTFCVFGVFLEKLNENRVNSIKKLVLRIIGLKLKLLKRFLHYLIASGIRVDAIEGVNWLLQANRKQANQMVWQKRY